MLSNADIEEEITLTVGKVRYLLVSNQENVNFIPDVNFKGDDPTLLIVYLTSPGDRISKSALLDFRTNVLDRDDVFQPEFCSNIVYYGSKKDDLEIEPDALEQLATWHTETQTFVTARSGANVAPGPYAIKLLCAIEHG
ncbi:uncharacterized protein KY384_001867 [Bacidia gigantensis]|uniref:uncharacterized protein n=1 Tax=Bacidia gigantensis TaxID=2732470 RepID=UPI001D059649|nr:uncharacterized protein KY384_001867 [Bacidia gigantensis]KAG8533084.1 hypothetical protein KY384_001867 [Bacidia gigantensis]